MHQILLISQVLVAVGLITLVLLQQGRGADAGAAFGSGASGSLFGSRGPTSFLARLTGILAAAFFANSIALAYISGQSVDRRSVVEQFETPQTPPTSSDEVSDSAPAEQSDVPQAAQDVPQAAQPEAEQAASGDVPADVPAAAGGAEALQDDAKSPPEGTEQTEVPGNSN